VRHHKKKSYPEVYKVTAGQFVHDFPNSKSLGVFKASGSSELDQVTERLSRSVSKSR
jgi:transposase